MKKFAVLLALLLALTSLPAMAAEAWEHEEPDYLEVAMYEGERISLSGYLQQEVRGTDYWSAKTIYCLYLDQPLDFTMLRHDGSSAAQLDMIQVTTNQSLSGLLDRRVTVQGIVAFADDYNDYSVAVAVTNAAVSRIEEEEVFYVPAPDLYEGSLTEYDTVLLSGNANLRDEPNLKGNSLGVMKKGDYATYFGLTEYDERGVAWYNVYHDRLGSGWVSGKYAKLVNGAQENVPVGYVYADGGKSNMRKTAGLDGKILCTFKKGDSALYLNEDFWDDRGVQWYKISYNDKIGWVSSRYTSLIYPDAPWYEDWDVQATASVYVRTGPGLSYGISGVMHKGDRLNHLGDTYYDDRGVAWYSVEGKNGQGWVSSRYSELSQEESPAAS